MSKTSLTLVIIGAINWLLIGLFRLDLIAVLFGGTGALVSRIFYVLVGLAGLYCIPSLFSDKKTA